MTHVQRGAPVSVAQREAGGWLRNRPIELVLRQHQAVQRRQAAAGQWATLRQLLGRSRQEGGAEHHHPGANEQVAGMGGVPMKRSSAHPKKKRSQAAIAR